MNQYFEVTVAYVVDRTKSGKDKVNKEVYLVDALTVTEADAKTIEFITKSGNQLDYTITSVKESRINDIVGING